MILQSCIPHIRCIFSNPLQESFVAISRGARWRLCWQAALTATGRRALTCSLHRVPCPASSLAVSFYEKEKQKRKAFQQLILFLLLDELLEKILNEPTLTLNMCLKSEVSCKKAGSFPAIVIWQLVSLPVNGNGQTLLLWDGRTCSAAQCLDWSRSCNAGTSYTLHAGDDSVDRWNTNKSKAFQQSCPSLALLTELQIFLRNVSKYSSTKWGGGTEKRWFSKRALWKKLPLNKGFIFIRQSVIFVLWKSSYCCQLIYMEISKPHFRDAYPKKKLQRIVQFVYLKLLPCICV